MADEKTVWKPVSVALDSELDAEIGRVAAETGATTSVVMREAIRAGLWFVLHRAQLDIELSSELRENLEKVSRWKGVSVLRVLEESARIGLPAVNIRLPNPEDWKSHADEERAIFDLIDQSDPRAYPLLEDLRKAFNEASWWRSFVAQLRMFPDTAAAVARVERVHRWMRKRKMPLPVVSPGVSVLPTETFERMEAEALEAEKSSTSELTPKLQAPPSPVPESAPSTEVESSPKPKPTRKPRKG